MGRRPRPISRAATKDERKKRRQKLGPLRELLIAPPTEVRYGEAVWKFFFWLGIMRLAFPGSFWDLDERCFQYIEELWSEGESLYHAADLLSGLQHYLPMVKRRLNQSWRLCAGWTRQELPNRAAPMTLEILMGILGLAVAMDDFEMAAMTGCAFFGMLRASEIFSLKRKHIAIRGSHITISLMHTKTTSRKRAYEVVTFKSRLISWLLSVLFGKRFLHSDLVQTTPSKFRGRLAVYLEFLGLAHVRFTFHSFRRGGATFDFQSHGLMDRTLLRGRWENSRTARIYINDGLASLVELNFPDTARDLCKMLFQMLKERQSQ